MMKKFSLSWSMTALLLLFSVSCGTSEEPTEVSETKTQPAGEAAVWQPTGDEGTITGKVTFEGQPPKLRSILMDADPVCAKKHAGPVASEQVVINDNGTLRNVFIYIKSGLDGKKFAIPDAPAVLDQAGCLYLPHVLGVQARQKLEVRTDDNTTHNIHPLPKVNREWNISQPPGADPIIKTFTRPEVMIPVKCNQHPWMRAYIGVMSNPFYAVTGADGTFEIKGLPPGEYEIEAWQEKYGAVTQTVTLGAKESKSIEFSYSADQAYHAGSLEMRPALTLP